MSKLYSNISTPNKREVTQSATITQQTHIRSWDSGIRVVARINDEDEAEFHLYRTSGSNGAHSEMPLGILRGEVFTPTK